MQQFPYQVHPHIPSQHPHIGLPLVAPPHPPSNPELHKRIDKLVEYVVKNGPTFEDMIREKQQFNLDYAFLFGGDGHGYYRYKLWLWTRGTALATNSFVGPLSCQNMPSSVASKQFLPNSVPLLPCQTINDGKKVSPYPSFPPGLIPGMVKKTQIGSGVPYSSMSPSDIPTVIPPSCITQEELLERVSKFFNDIRQVNTSQEPLKFDAQDFDDDNERDYKRETSSRKEGVCIPLPPNISGLG
ncbi:hypothetical protein CsatB_002432 [Cannabis sativa]